MVDAVDSGSGKFPTALGNIVIMEASYTNQLLKQFLSNAVASTNFENVLQLLSSVNGITAACAVSLTVAASLSFANITNGTSTEEIVNQLEVSIDKFNLYVSLLCSILLRSTFQKRKMHLLSL